MNLTEVSRAAARVREFDRINATDGRAAALCGVYNRGTHVHSLDRYALADAYLALVPADLAETFARLAAEFREAFECHSDTQVTAAMPSCLRIIGLGPAVLPLLFAEFRRHPSPHWWAALEALTGADPVPPEARGRVEATAASWLAWGEATGVCLERS